VVGWVDIKAVVWVAYSNQQDPFQGLVKAKFGAEIIFFNFC
jgi:hypothetical protein